MTISELKDHFLKYLVEYRGRTGHTKEAYDFDLNKFIFCLKSKNIDDINEITTNIIEDYLFSLQTSTVTKARVRSSLKSFFNFLSRKQYIKNNPAINLESMKLPEKRPEYLSQEQCASFITTIEKVATPYYKERDLMLVKLLLRTGLRRAELCLLNVNDVDLSKLRLRVRRKGNREEYVIIHHELAIELKRYLFIIQREGVEPLFMSKKGGRLSESSIWHVIKNYSKKAGLNGSITTHSLRHTFATTLLAKSMPIPYIQALMGHRSSQTTYRYLHFQNNELTDAFNKVSFERR